MLRRLKLVDPDGRVSLTNLALYIVLGAFVYTVVRTGSVEVSALGALLTALTAYRTKALQVDKREMASESETVAKLKAELADARRASTVRSTSAALPQGLR